MNKKVVSLGAIIAAVVFLPVLLWLSQQRHDIRNKAAEPLPTPSIDFSKLKTPETELTPFEKLDQNTIPKSLRDVDQKFDIKGIKPIFE